MSSSSGIDSTPGVWPASYSITGAHVEDDGLPGHDPAKQFSTVDLLGVVGIEVGPCCLVDVGKVLGGDLAQPQPQRGEVVAGHGVLDRGAVTGGAHQTGSFERLKVRRRRGQPETGGVGELGDGTRTVRQQVQQLQALAVAEGLADACELLEQLGLRGFGHQMLQ